MGLFLFCIVLEQRFLHNKNEILLEIAEGNQSAFEQLYVHYRDRIYTTAIRITESEADAEEIVQDVFVKLWSRRKSIASIESLDDYIFIMARNYTFNALKRVVRQKQNLLHAAKELSVATPEIILEDKDFQRVLNDAVDKLPPQQQTVYKLIKNNGLTKIEVAEKLGISPNTVKTHYDTAIRQVRAYCMANLDLGVLFLLFYSGLDVI